MTTLSTICYEYQEREMGTKDHNLREELLQGTNCKECQSKWKFYCQFYLECSKGCA